MAFAARSALAARTATRSGVLETAGDDVMASDPLLRWEWEGGAPGPAAGIVERGVRVSPPAAPEKLTDLGVAQTVIAPEQG
jgi:hypothetical protein